jgi:hypothetical protein
VLRDRHAVAVRATPRLAALHLYLDYVTGGLSAIGEGDVQVLTKVVLSIDLLNDVIMPLQ